MLLDESIRATLQLTEITWSPRFPGVIFIPMHTQSEHRGIITEHVSCPITLMNIKVNNNAFVHSAEILC